MNPLRTPMGRLRSIAFLEGSSLIVLVLIGVPLKHFMDMPKLVMVLGPIHGALFLLYIFIAISVGTVDGWKKSKWFKVLVASLVPFGTFYVNRYILDRKSKSRGI